MISHPNLVQRPLQQQQLLLPALALAVLASLAVGLLIGDHGLAADLLRSSIGFTDSNGQIGESDFTKLLGVGAKLLPLGLVITVAAFPLACLIGGVAMSFGSKTGLKIVGMAFGACLFMTVAGGVAS